jgi:hypothetical protein
MSIELKVKSKHLSVEAQIIRHEERKMIKQYRWSLDQHKNAGNNDEYAHFKDVAYLNYRSLNKHRRCDVRNENRATFLARAYIAGVPYNTVENKRKNDAHFMTFIIPRVVAMVAKYGTNNIEPRIYNLNTRVFIENPALTELKTNIIVWSTIT